ncbi:GerAB/ArcD/ProY family transporter [Clostridium pasteurianum]|nr:spore germination protein [Clostridium pasteurianum DSM 525 = ATCC 6013]
MTMLYPFLIQRTKLKKIVISTVILEVIFLILNSILFIVTLGYEFAISTDYPLLEALRLVHIGDFLNRLDTIFVIILTLGGFFKISILMYASALGISQMFKFKNWGLLCIILGVFIIITSLIMARNNPEHLNIGWNFMVIYISIPLYIIIPLLSLIIYHVKGLIKK